MKLKDAIEQIDRLKPNKFTDEEKTKWLYELDGKIFREIVETHVRPAYLASIRYLRPYVAGQDDELVLLAPEPHDVVYRWWLECQIDIGNNEISRYNNSRTMFNQAYEELQGWWNRMYMPVGPVDAIGFTLGRKPGPHPHGMPPDAHGPHEHHHILAKDVVNALGYRPEVEGKAAELDEKVMLLLEAEEHTRGLGDDNTLIAAKAYADSRIEYASADISMDVDEKLGKLYEDVTGNMVAMRVLIDTAVGSAEGAQRAAENVLDASRNVVSDARQSIALANAATAEAREAYRAAMALEDGARVAEQLKGDAGFMESVTGKDGKDGEDGAPGRDGSDAEVTAENIAGALGYTPANPAGVVSGVKVAGTELEKDASGTVDVPIATTSRVGVVYTKGSSGIMLGPDGELYLRRASESTIDSRDSNRILYASNTDYAVKAALTDGKGAWSVSEQAAARELIGAAGVYELIETITYDGATNAIYRNITPDGRAYAFDAIMLVWDGNGANVVHTAVVQANGSRLWASDRVMLGNTSSYDATRAIVRYTCETGAFIAVDASGVPYNGARTSMNLQPLEQITSLEINTNGTKPVAGATCKIYARWVA